MKIKSNHVNTDNWSHLSVSTKMPKKLEALNEMAHNLRWAWDVNEKQLFKYMDPELWSNILHNPMSMLENISLERLNELSEDKVFLAMLDSVYNEFTTYVNAKPSKDIPSIAYFSMEYGMTDHLKIYSGGLGVLAGDYLKEASDHNVNMTAIGFLYRYGYFTQSLSIEGQQLANYEAQNFESLPIVPVMDENGTQRIIAVPYPDRFVYARLWQVNVGRIKLYLLDTDIEKNSEFDRQITHQLYGGDWENRIKQEILLGIGGIITLKTLGIKKQVYHCNEGHAALLNVQRLVDYVAEGLTIDEALEAVGSSSLYTVHTPVPAGHDAFDEGLFGKYMSAYPQQLGLTWNEFIDLGRENPGSTEKFSMSVFACNTCHYVNGVSWLHGKVSKKMFAPIWKGYFPEENHVGYVTNGVHLPTWATSEWKAVYEKYFGEEFYLDQSNKELWKNIARIPDHEIWDTRMELKNKLIEFIRTQFKKSWFKTQQDPSKIVSVLDKINPNALIIGFGRRFATYKRAHLLFTDLERLERIINNPEQPVQFLFTGKAHPADAAGQGLIKHIIEISRMPQFLGKIIFLENYDMRLAKRLISGVDIWMNTPTRPLEASGTSGEKAQMNGVLNFSVLDGWWLEGYVEGAGWALTEKRTYDNQQYQDQLDAATIYSMLENEIVPLYFDKNVQGYSPKWIATIKKSMMEIAPRFTTKRMMDDYITRFYKPSAKRSAHMNADHFKATKALIAWEADMASKWDNIEVISASYKNSTKLTLGSSVDYNVVIDIKDLDNKGIGVECVYTTLLESGKKQFIAAQGFNLVKTEGSRLYFNLKREVERSGSFDFIFRMYPKHEDLANRMSFCYVRWITPVAEK